MMLKHSGGSSASSKGHKKLWIILSILVVILIIPILTAGWLGFIPGLSNLMGSSQAKDLGVRYNDADISSYKQKTTITIKDYSLAPADPNNTSEKSVLADPKPANNLSLSQEEITAALNTTGWTWMPVKNTQVRLNDGTFEISGNLNLDRIDEFNQYINNAGNKDQDISNAINWAARLANNAPVYIKASAQIDNNVLSFTLLEAQIGRLSIPLGTTGQDLSSGKTQVKINTDNFDAKSAKLVDGNLIFTGTYPSTIYLKK